MLKARPSDPLGKSCPSINVGIESALIPDRTSFCAFADSRLRVFLAVTTYVVVEKPDSTKGVGSH